MVASDLSGAARCRARSQSLLRNVIAVLISVAVPKLTGKGLEEPERVKRENATCLQ